MNPYYVYLRDCPFITVNKSLKLFIGYSMDKYKLLMIESSAFFLLFITLILMLIG